MEIKSFWRMGTDVDELNGGGLEATMGAGAVAWKGLGLNCAEEPDEEEFGIRAMGSIGSQLS
ncbi:hypothetical protein C2845_PM13G06570 [Panicum miliaceum]|uniref:Uncharacterized protein n=1 Tax=Panicum miliaceum TaxID=4540 RepID=A0A3L6RIL3_PANMI|nr:hypothetical protein C2845_PM13G06570 [Panicum miliaceum]